MVRLMHHLTQRKEDRSNKVEVEWAVLVNLMEVVEAWALLRKDLLL